MGEGIAVDIFFFKLEKISRKTMKLSLIIDVFVITVISRIPLSNNIYYDLKTILRRYVRNVCTPSYGIKTLLFLYLLRLVLLNLSMVKDQFFFSFKISNLLQRVIFVNAIKRKF